MKQAGRGERGKRDGAKERGGGKREGTRDGRGRRGERGDKAVTAAAMVVVMATAAETR